MAKRRRLSPAPGLDWDTVTPAPMPGPLPEGRAPEVKALGLGGPPVAQIAAAEAMVSALEGLTEVLTEARARGHLAEAVPLEAVETGWITRDRIGADAEAMAALMESLRARGQQVPVELTELPGGRYGLISGFRRVEALRRLQAETGEARFGRVLAVMRRPDSAGAAYLAMVEENEIRLGLSHYERARIVAQTAGQGVFPDIPTALRALFGTASRARRSKIGSFVTVVQALDGALAFPQAISERLGLALAQALEADPGLGPRIAADLAAKPAADAAAETARLARAVAAAGRAARPDRAAPPPFRLAAEPCAGGFVLRLTGAGATPALQAALRDWLIARGGQS